MNKKELETALNAEQDEHLGFNRLSFTKERCTI